MSDRETLDSISESLYLQYFCGLPSFQTERPFDPSFFVDIRKRLGESEFDAFNSLVIAHADKMLSKSKTGKNKSDSGTDNDDHNPNPNTPAKNKGTLKVDATVADQQITFPTDLKILATARQETERLVDVLYAQIKLKAEAEAKKKAESTKPKLKPKPRTYRREARQEYLKIVKLKRKSKNSIRKAIGKQLRYIKRNVATIERLLDLFKEERFPLKHRDLRQYWIIQTVYDQQKIMFDDARKRSVPHRIVSIWQPHVRPIVRGKEKARVEFGAKINVSEYDGWSRIDRLNWEAYNEGGDLKQQIENYKKQRGYYPATVLADQLYTTRENRKFMKELGIHSPCKALGRPSKEPETPYQRRKIKKERGQRNSVEGKFGQAKNGYGLNEIRARRKDTSESWIGAIFFIMNLITLMKKAEKLFLCPLLWVIAGLKAHIRSIQHTHELFETKINMTLPFRPAKNQKLAIC